MYYEFRFELRKKGENGGPPTVLRCGRVRREWVVRIFSEGVRALRKKLRASTKLSSLSTRGRPARADVTRALQLFGQGVSKKEVYKLLRIAKRARGSFRQALWRRKHQQDLLARKT